MIGRCLSATSRLPWSVEELDSCFVVEDANGQALAYMYFEISHSVMQHSNA
jgi:hypothetical protein